MQARGVLARVGGTSANSTSVLVVMATPSTTGSTLSRREIGMRSARSSREKKMVNIGPSVLMVCVKETETESMLQR